MADDTLNWLNLIQEIKKVHRKFCDKQVNQEIQKQNPNFVKDKIDNVWTWKNRVYIPIKPQLREWVISHCHTFATAGHPGVTKTLELTTQTFWWPNMKKDIENYVKGCHLCQANKPD